MPRPRPCQSLLTGTAHLLIDGNNLLHRTAGSTDPGARRTLLARLRAGVPEEVETVVVLDGNPDPGGPFRERIRRGLEVRHAGRVDADSALVAIVSARPFADRARTVVVTDDRALTERIRHVGGRTARLADLETLLSGGGGSGGTGASGANAQPPRAAPSTLGAPAARGTPPGRRPTPDGAAGDAVDPDDEPPGWTPGRGATRKRGNPRRGRKGPP